MSAEEAIKAAKSVMPGAPEHFFACQLCILRGYEPNDCIQTVKGLESLTNWQWIVAEQIIEAGLRHAMGMGARAQGLVAN
jgi:hypothetical protein